MTTANRAARARKAAAKNATIHLEKILVKQHQEGGSIFVKPGDEPYFVVIRFRSRVATKKTTTVTTNKYKNDSWAENIKKNKSKKIPASMGVSTFADVQLTSLEDIANGTMPEIIGCVVLSVESDGTSWGTIGGFIKKAASAIKREVANIVEKLNIYPLDPGQGLTEAIDRIKAKVKPEQLEGLLAWFGSGGDFDDIIGSHTFLFVCVDDVIGAKIPKKDTRTVTAGAARNVAKELEFKGDGAKYVVPVSVEFV